MLLAFLSIATLVVEGAIWIWLLWLVDLDVPLGFLICMVAPLRLMSEVPIELSSHLKNATFYRASFSLTSE